jgi:hypothetical protein
MIVKGPGRNTEQTRKLSRLFRSSWQQCVSHEYEIALHIVMCLFQANRTAHLVHKLMNIYDDPDLKEEVMVRNSEIL